MKHYINLTNGIGLIKDLPRVDGFLRIQSTACEQKRWWQIIADLDYSFMVDVACGHDCMSYDMSG